jgi:hypothetical protein
MKRISHTNGFILALALLTLLLMALGCGLAEKLKSAANNPSNTTRDNRGAPSDPSGNPKSGEKLYESQAQLREFVTALTAAVGSDNPKLLKITIYDTYASAEVQDPKKPENVDNYSWRGGKMAPPSPVRIIGSGKIDENVFPLKDVNLDGLPDLTKEILEKLKDVEGGNMVGYTVSRGLPFSKDVHISPLANSTRKTVYTEADKDAKLKKFEVK